MSNDIEFWLEVKLTKDGRKIRIEVSSSTSSQNLDVLSKTIEKALEKGVDLNPLAGFMKDKELDYLIKQGWKIIDLDFILHRSQLLEFFEQHPNGVTPDQLKGPWNHVSSSRIGDTLFALQLDYLVCPARFVGRGGYILKKYYDKASKKVYEPDSETEQKTKSQPKSSVSKSEGKQHRKNIINKATKTDICEGGFRPEFIEKLDDREQDYLNSLSNLQIKIMRTEVSKK